MPKESFLCETNTNITPHVFFFIWANLGFFLLIFVHLAIQNQISVSISSINDCTSKMLIKILNWGCGMVGPDWTMASSCKPHDNHCTSHYSIITTPQHLLTIKQQHTLSTTRHTRRLVEKSSSGNLVVVLDLVHVARVFPTPQKL